MNHSISFVCKAFYQLSLNELYDSMKLRQKVFIVEQNCPYLDTDDKDQAAHHLLGIQNQSIVAYARLLPKGISYEDYVSIGRIVTAETQRGKGYGIALVKEAILQCKLLFKADQIKISAQQYLIQFYESHGFQAVGEGYLEDGIPHIAMIWKATTS